MHDIGDFIETENLVDHNHSFHQKTNQSSHTMYKDYQNKGLDIYCFSLVITAFIIKHCIVYHSSY